MPDYTGVFGAILSIIFKKEYFIQTIADWGLQGNKTPIFKKYGLGLFLKIHYFIYDYCERLLCKKGLVFCQGSSSYNKHKNNPDSIIISRWQTYRGKKSRVANTYRIKT